MLRTVEERGVRFIQLWFTDVLGTPKSFQITPAELENALGEGMTFDGSTIDGFSRVQESDVLAMPDAKTFQLLPYLADGHPVARVVCDVVNLDGSPFEGDPRHVLRRALERARALGFSYFVAPGVMSVSRTSLNTRMWSPPRTGSGQEKTGRSTQSEALPGA